MSKASELLQNGLLSIFRVFYFCSDNSYADELGSMYHGI